MAKYTSHTSRIRYYVGNELVEFCESDESCADDSEATNDEADDTLTDHLLDRIAALTSDLERQRELAEHESKQRVAAEMQVERLRRDLDLEYWVHKNRADKLAIKEREAEETASSLRAANVELAKEVRRRLDAEALLERQQELFEHESQQRMDAEAQVQRWRRISDLLAATFENVTEKLATKEQELEQQRQAFSNLVAEKDRSSAQELARAEEKSRKATQEADHARQALRAKERDMDRLAGLYNDLRTDSANLVSRLHAQGNRLLVLGYRSGKVERVVEDLRRKLADRSAAGYVTIMISDLLADLGALFSLVAQSPQDQDQDQDQEEKNPA